MDIEGITLGLVQGLTEFIPVSSSGHLLLIQHLFSGETNTFFIQSLNIGTLLALLIYFRSKIWEILKKLFVDKDIRYARNIILTALPAGVSGYFFSDFFDGFSTPIIMVVMLISIGIVMMFLDKIPTLSRKSDGEKLSWKRALAIGFAQVIALIPGSSRLGTTIIAGKVAGLKIGKAAEYSFLVSIPLMAGLILKLFIEDIGLIIQNWQNILIGNLVAFLVGIVAIQFMMDFLSKHSLKVFGIYRILLAGLIIVLLTLNVIQ